MESVQETIGHTLSALYYSRDLNGCSFRCISSDEHSKRPGSSSLRVWMRIASHKVTSFVYFTSTTARKHLASVLNSMMSVGCLFLSGTLS